jgi:hypothetical protein
LHRPLCNRPSSKFPIAAVGNRARSIDLKKIIIQKNIDLKNWSLLAILANTPVPESLSPKNAVTTIRKNLCVYFHRRKSIVALYSVNPLQVSLACILLERCLSNDGVQQELL